MFVLDRCTRQRIRELLCDALRRVDRHALLAQALPATALPADLDWGGSDYVFSGRLLNCLQQQAASEQECGAWLRVLLQVCRAGVDGDVVLRVDAMLARLQAGTRDRLWRGCPYPGLVGFQPTDAAIYFGRDYDVEQALEHLRDPRGQALCVVGASGCGKSSFVNAGVLPALGRGAVSGSEHWAVYRLVAGDARNPFLSLAWAFEDVLHRLGQSPPEFALDLAADVSRGDALVDAVLSEAPQLLVFIDQLEELFTLVGAQYRAPFMDWLDYVARRPGVRLLAALRVDAYAAGIGDEVLADWLRRAAFPLAPPGPAQLRAMITGPARLAGARVEPGLLARLLADGAAGPGRLPLLAFVLRRLWQTRVDGELSLAAYEALGGLEHAIGRLAEPATRGFAAELPAWFAHLAAVDAQGTATRRYVRAALLRQHGAGGADWLGVLSAPDLGLLRVDGDSVTLSHEILLTAWPALAAWLAARPRHPDATQLIRDVADGTVVDDGRRTGTPHAVSTQRMATAYTAPGAASWPRVEGTASVLVAALAEPDLSLAQRLDIGDRLAWQGDGRPGVGVRADGVPDLAWLAIDGGIVRLSADDDARHVEPFHMARYPVTYIQYRAFLEAEDGYAHPAWWRDLQYMAEPGAQYRVQDNCPADHVSWYDAVAYTRWLSARLGYWVGLPDEWQWRLAATGSDPSRGYPWGSEWRAGHCNSAETRWSRTCAVGILPLGASRHGVADMAGNVWEWCAHTQEDVGTSEASTRDDWRVVCGGAWSISRAGVGCGARRPFHAPLRSADLGFRLCCLHPRP